MKIQVIVLGAQVDGKDIRLILGLREEDKIRQVGTLTVPVTEASFAVPFTKLIVEVTHASPE